MKEQIQIVTDLIQSIWLQRRWMAISLLIICPLGWGVVTMLPNQYTSEARVYADTRSILQPLLKGLAINTDPSRELSLIVKTLLSRSNLETIVRYADADIQVTNSEEYEELLKNLRDNIKIKSAGRENLFTISYIGNEPQYVKNIVQSALDVFVDSAVGRKRQDTSKAGKFIDQQIVQYEARLKQSEAALAEFKKRYQGYEPGDEGVYFKRIEQRQSEYEATQLSILEKKTQLNSAKNKLAEEKQRVSQNQFGMETEYDARLALLEARLDELLYRYTQKHPNVKETQRQIKELKEQKRVAISSAARRGELLSSEQANYLTVLIQQLNTELASLGIRAQAQLKKLEDLKQRIQDFPDIEAELTGLMRNYNITKSKYEELLSRRESAMLSQEVGVASDEITFKVVDPPQLPLKPSGPIRPLYVSVVLLLGIAGGLGCSFLVSQVSPVVTSSEQLYRDTHIPVFGAVSMLDNSKHKRSIIRKNTIFYLICLSVLTLFVGVMLINIIPQWHAQFIKDVITL